MKELLNQAINLILIVAAVQDSDDSDFATISGDMLFVLLLILFAANGKKLNDSANKPSTKETCQMYNRIFVAVGGLIAMFAKLAIPQFEDKYPEVSRLVTYDMPFLMTFMTQMCQLASDMLCDSNYELPRKIEPATNIGRLNYCRYLGTGYQVALSKNPSPLAAVAGMLSVSLDIVSNIYKTGICKQSTYEKLNHEEKARERKILARADKIASNMTIWNDKKSAPAEVNVKNENVKSLLYNPVIFKQHKKSIEEVEIKNERKIALEIEEKAETLNTAGNANAKI